MMRFIIISHEIYTLGKHAISISPNNKVHVWSAGEIIASLDEWYCCSKIRKLNDRVHTSNFVLTFQEIPKTCPQDRVNS